MSDTMLERVMAAMMKASYVEGLTYEQERRHIARAAIEAMPAHAAVIEFATAILHGDDEHREWLMEAATAFNAGAPMPPPRGKGAALQPATDSEAQS